MNISVITERISEASPRFKSRVAGAFYLVTFVTGIFSLMFANGGLIANLTAMMCYAVVTVLFYALFKPVNKSISLLATFFSFAGCISSALSAFDVTLFHINSLVFFGFYCLLIGLLIFRSTFLPRILGVPLVIAGLSWLTFLSPPLGNSLAPYNISLGALGEGTLMLWLLLVGVNDQRWKEQAGRKFVSEQGPIGV